jgi:hypothetical protein
MFVEQLVVIREVAPLADELFFLLIQSLHRLNAFDLDGPLDEVLFGEENGVIESVAVDGDVLQGNVKELLMFLAYLDESFLEGRDEVERIFATPLDQVNEDVFD